MSWVETAKHWVWGSDLTTQNGALKITCKGFMFVHPISQFGLPYQKSSTYKKMIPLK